MRLAELVVTDRPVTAPFAAGIVGAMRRVAVLALGLTGCIPIPAVLPPAKASLGLGAAIGFLKRLRL